MKEFLTIDEEIFINQFSRGINTLDEMKKWFFSYSVEDRRDIIKHLFNMLIQAHPTYNEIETTINNLKKQNSSSTCKLLNKNKPFNKFGYEISSLPE